MDNSTFDLQRLIHPIDVQTFLSEFWEKQPLVIQRQDRRYYEDLMSLGQLDQILGSSGLRSGNIRLLREGHEISVSSLLGERFSAHVSLLESIYAEYRDGATIVVQLLHERYRPLMRLCQSLARELSAAFQVNVYLTPPNARGLPTHRDTHDVFVLQCAGSKHWRIYESSLPLPFKGQRDEQYAKEVTDPGPPREEFDLQSGEAIYIPRGYLHDATSHDETSLHLTVGVHPITWGSLFLGAIDSAIERDERFRESLPAGFTHDARGRERTKEQLVELLGALWEHFDPDALIDTATDGASVTVQPVLDGHLLDLVELPTLDLTTRARLRPGVQCRISIDDAVCLRFHGKLIRMPVDVESDVRFILSSQAFTPADLPGDFDAESKLVLVRRLIREGLVTICRD